METMKQYDMEKAYENTNTEGSTEEVQGKGSLEKTTEKFLCVWYNGHGKDKCEEQCNLCKSCSH